MIRSFARSSLQSSSSPPDPARLRAPAPATAASGRMAAGAFAASSSRRRLICRRLFFLLLLAARLRCDLAHSSSLFTSSLAVDGGCRRCLCAHGAPAVARRLAGGRSNSSRTNQMQRRRQQQPARGPPAELVHARPVYEWTRQQAERAAAGCARGGSESRGGADSPSARLVRRGAARLGSDLAGGGQLRPAGAAPAAHGSLGGSLLALGCSRKSRHVPAWVVCRAALEAGGFEVARFGLGFGASLRGGREVVSNGCATAAIRNGRAARVYSNGARRVRAFQCRPRRSVSVASAGRAQASNSGASSNGWLAGCWLAATGGIERRGSPWPTFSRRRRLSAATRRLAASRADDDWPTTTTVKLAE